MSLLRFQPVVSSRDNVCEYGKGWSDGYSSMGVPHRAQVAQKNPQNVIRRVPVVELSAQAETVS